MKHPKIYYVYYLAGWLFIGLMAVVIVHMIQLWITASSM
jgi:hypothetical protein